MNYLDFDRHPLLMKGRSLGMKLMVVVVLVTTLVGLAGTPAKAQDSYSWMPDPDTTEIVTGCSWYMYEECAITPEDVSGAGTASPSTPATSASPSASASTPASASASAPASASPSTPATSASPSASATASAAGDQYGPVPDTRGKAAPPAQTGKTEDLPNTGGRTAKPPETTEATGLPETNRNSSVLPLMVGSAALLVGGGLLARRLIR